MKRLFDWLVLLGIVAAIFALQACAWGEWFRENVAANPDQANRAVGSLVSNLVSGNWIGAAMNGVDYLLIGSGVYKATNMRRDSLRKKRGEPIGKEPIDPPPGSIATPIE